MYYTSIGLLLLDNERRLLWRRWQRKDHAIRERKWRETQIEGARAAESPSNVINEITAGWALSL